MNWRRTTGSVWVAAGPAARPPRAGRPAVRGPAGVRCGAEGLGEPQRDSWPSITMPRSLVATTATPALLEKLGAPAARARGTRRLAHRAARRAGARAAEPAGRRDRQHAVGRLAAARAARARARRRARPAAARRADEPPRHRRHHVARGRSSPSTPAPSSSSPTTARFSSVSRRASSRSIAAS